MGPDDSYPDFDPDRDPALIARYLAGECTGEEARRFERWVAGRPERSAFLQELREARRITSEQNQESYDLDVEWAKLSARTDLGARPTRPPLELTVHRRSPRLRLARQAAVAAALILGVGLGTWLARQDLPRSRTPAATGTLRDVTTRPGQRADIYLSDGTHVVLGAASRLRFAAPLGTTSRDVYLEGEALFEVTHREDWPFLVRTAHAITEDLGTKFSVRAYPADSVVTVAVAEGRVALRRDAAAGTVLGEGDLGRMTARGELEREHGAVLDPYLAWADGRLVFTDTPLRDVLRQLGRWYDVELHAADPSVAGRRLTAAFTNESIDELLRNVALTLDVRYERRGRHVTFYSK